MHMRQALFLLSELIEKYTYMFLFHPSPHLLNYLHIPPQSSHSFPQVTPRLFILAPGVCFATASSYLSCQLKALWSWFNTQHDSGTKRGNYLQLCPLQWSCCPLPYQSHAERAQPALSLGADNGASPGSVQFLLYEDAEGELCTET